VVAALQNLNSRTFLKFQLHYLGLDMCQHFKGVAYFTVMSQVVTNPYSSTGGEMRQYHHVKCIFDTFVRARPTTKIITEVDDIRGFDDLEESDQSAISEAIDGWSTFNITLNGCCCC